MMTLWFMLTGLLLGQGAFGKVVKGEAIGIKDGEESTIVAVKMPKGEYCFQYVVSHLNKNSLVRLLLAASVF